MREDQAIPPFQTAARNGPTSGFWMRWKGSVAGSVPSALAVAVLGLTLAIAPATAQEVMDAEAFDEFTQGSTLTYNSGGQPYGIEQYLPNRRVRWAFIGNECREGVWYERSGMICFLYEHAPRDEQCWVFTRSENGGMRAVFQGPDGPSTELYEVQRSSEPLSCSGPDVGV